MQKTSRWPALNNFYLACFFSILVLGINLAAVYLVADPAAEKPSIGCNFSRR